MIRQPIIASDADAELRLNVKAAWLLLTDILAGLGENEAAASDSRSAA